jgi:hypothetical protein
MGFLVANVNEAVRALARLPEIDGGASHRRVRDYFSVDTMVAAYQRVYALIFEMQEKRQHEARYCSAV